jgi:UPF0755 protein
MDEKTQPQIQAESKLSLPFKSLLQKEKFIWLIGILLVVFMGYYLFLHKPPEDFPLGTVITIESGESLQSITDLLYENHIIKSPFWFRTHVIIQGGEKKVKAGDYLLDYKEGPADLAYRFVHGQSHLVTTKITIPEGWNIYQIGDYLSTVLINFDKKSFLKLAKDKEGYLFPDTYFVSPAARPSKIVNLMENNFSLKEPLIPGIGTTTRDLKDVIIVASILEDEARTTESRRVISGILWKRLALGMPLQVDSTFIYINGKNTYELTSDDLKIDSPYNTYFYRGLPPTPIGNPGEDAIFSAVNPISTKYLYFLSSKSGKMYYATTFDEHIRNKELYLNK